MLFFKNTAVKLLENFPIVGTEVSKFDAETKNINDMLCFCLYLTMNVVQANDFSFILI